MNLVFIYGPPAVGKLTVAKELSLITGYPVFHNHLTRNLVHELFPSALKENYELVNKLRNEVLEYASLHGENMIFTYVYSGASDDDAVNEIVSRVEKNAGNVLFVELLANESELLTRVTDESRRSHKKLTDAEELKTYLDKTQYPSVPYENILKIDTTNTPPVEVAGLITDHFGLLQKKF